MALFGSERDARLVKHINRELIYDFIDTEIAFYKLSLDDTKANICENLGKDSFLGLYELDRRVKAKLIWVKDQYSYGDKALWLLHDDEQVLFGGKKFLPSNYGNGRSRILNSFNLKERYEDDDAWACFSKGWSSTPNIFRVGDEWGATAELIKEDQ